MIRNFLKIALRNIAKEKFYSFINILGLTIGITAALFVVIYITDEVSYDRFHTKIDRMYRLWISGKIGGQEFKGTWISPPVAHTFKDEIPEVAEACRLYKMDEILLKYEKNAFSENLVYYADSNFFQFFSFKLIQGDPSTVLNEPNSIVLTRSMAKKYFGNETGVGKVISVFNDKIDYKVTGIAEDPPENSHFDFNALLAMSSYGFSKSTSWTSNSFKAYLILYPGSDPEEVAKKMRDVTVAHVGPELQQYMGLSFKEFEEQGGRYGYFIQPVKDIHLHSHLDGELKPNSDISYMYIFGAIGIFILLIACINFMNMSTARSAGRSKEVGLRKTLGSMKGHLIFQFLSESIIYSLFAMILAIVAFYLLMPSFNQLSGKELNTKILLDIPITASLLGITLLTGLLAGSYPAFYLTSFRVSEVLKGSLKAGVKSKWIRAILVTLQFSISIILIICTSIVYRQLQFVQNKNLGFDKENVMVVQNTDRLGNSRQAFKNAIIRQSGIVSASYSDYVFPGVNNTTVFRDPEAGDVDHLMGAYFGDYDQVQTMGFQIVKGRNFSRDIPSDSSGILINEAAVKEYGWDDPLGKELLYYGSDVPVRLRVVGILKDFNFESLRNQVRPISMRLLNNGNQMTIRIKMENPRDAVKLVENHWKELAPDEPFEYNFLDQRFDDLYRSEQRLGGLFTMFTGIAIFIACLGLFGLAAFIAEQRTKEIGIRKAMGASTIGITTLLSKEFAKFVIIAFLVAIIPSYLVMTDWLQGFTYRISLDPLIFMTGGFIAFIIAIATVSYQSLKAASTNPATSLRYE